MFLRQIKPRDIYDEKHYWTFAKKTISRDFRNQKDGYFSQPASFFDFELEFIL